MRKILSVMQCIATRFEQEDFKIYVNIQELLLKSFASEPCDTELAEVVKMDSSRLKGHLLLLGSLFRQSQHKRKIRDKTRGIVHNCSDLICTKN